MSGREQALIRSGQFGEPGATRGYRYERLGEVVIERVVWQALDVPRRAGATVVADEGYVWYRFWAARYDQVIERYFAPDGRPLGTHIDVCGPLTCDDAGCWALDLLLDIWIDPAGHVTVVNQDRFEAAVRAGELSPEQAALAERHVRELTAAIARGRFPPPLVRNWQIDPTRFE